MYVVVHICQLWGQPFPGRPHPHGNKPCLQPEESRLSSERSGDWLPGRCPKQEELIGSVSKTRHVSAPRTDAAWLLAPHKHACAEARGFPCLERTPAVTAAERLAKFLLEKALLGLGKALHPECSGGRLGREQEPACSCARSAMCLSGDRPRRRRGEVLSREEHRVPRSARIRSASTHTAKPDTANPPPPFIM